MLCIYQKHTCLVVFTACRMWYNVHAGCVKMHTLSQCCIICKIGTNATP